MQKVLQFRMQVHTYWLQKNDTFCKNMSLQVHELVMRHNAFIKLPYYL